MNTSSSLQLDVPAGTRTYRTSLSLPAELAVGINLLAKRLGISQSALVTALLSETISDCQLLLDELPENPDPDLVRRFRGKSIEVVNEAVNDLLKQV
jgi:hypothetical protein